MGRRSADHLDQTVPLVAEGPFKLMKRLERLLRVIHLPAIPQVVFPLGSRWQLQLLCLFVAVVGLLEDPVPGFVGPLDIALQ
jgi:hypothetical protein